MFKKILKKFIETYGITQIELSEMVGDSQQAISDFLRKEGNTHKKTKDKYFDNLEGFKDYYNNSINNQVNSKVTGDNNTVNINSENEELKKEVLELKDKLLKCQQQTIDLLSNKN